MICNTKNYLKTACPIDRRACTRLPHDCVLKTELWEASTAWPILGFGIAFRLMCAALVAAVLCGCADRADLTEHQRRKIAAQLDAASQAEKKSASEAQKLLLSPPRLPMMNARGYIRHVHSGATTTRQLLSMVDGIGGVWIRPGAAVCQPKCPLMKTGHTLKLRCI